VVAVGDSRIERVERVADLEGLVEEMQEVVCSCFPTSPKLEM
jgi:hypothetical protein